MSIYRMGDTPTDIEATYRPFCKECEWVGKRTADLNFAQDQASQHDKEHSKMKASELKPGMLVDLENDPYTTCADEECSNCAMWEYEYGEVDDIDQETPECVRVDFTNGDSIGFPTDHEVNVIIETKATK